MIVDAEQLKALLLPLDQLRACGGDLYEYDGHAVYFLWWYCRLQYIGQTWGLCNRIRCHRLPYTRVSWCEVNPQDAAAVEREYVEAYRPPYNQLAGGNITTKGRQWIR